MSTETPARRILTTNDIRRLVVFSILLLVIVHASAWFAGGFDDWSAVSWRPGLNLAAFFDAPRATQVHAVFILTLVVTGWVMIALPKGDRRHRFLGWLWIGSMVVMGLGSLAVPHGDSWVAAYAGGGSALALMAFGIYSVKRRRLRHHGRTMSMLMIALVLMTLLSVFPGRVMHEVLFGG